MCTATDRRPALSVALAVTLVLALLAPMSASAFEARDPERGRLEVLNFEPNDYNNLPQNWSMTLDARGVLYVGNTAGVLEYDGVSWRLIRTDRGTAARSMDTGHDGRVYVGGQAEFGYLAADEHGAMRFVSLVPEVPEDQRDFADIWWTLATSHGVYFQSLTRIFRWHQDRLDSWQVSEAMPRMFRVGDRILLKDAEAGLLELVDDEFRPLPDAETINALRITALLSTPEAGDPDRMLLMTGEGALWRHAQGRFSPIELPADHPLASIPPYHGRTLAPGLHGIATLYGGFLLIDDDGRLVDHFDRAGGLLADQVLAFAPDAAGGIWLGLGNGISRVSAFSRLSRIGPDDGLPGIVISLNRYAGQLVIGSMEGLFVRDGTGTRRIEGLSGPIWDMQPSPHGLLIGDRNGMYQWDGTAIEQIADIQPLMVLEPDPERPDRFWFGHSRGLASMQHDGQGWQLGPNAVITSSFVRTIAADGKGRLVLGTEQDGVLRIDPRSPPGEDGLLPASAVERFGPEQGLISPNRTQVAATPDGVRIWNERRLFRFDDRDERLVVDPAIERLMQRNEFDWIDVPFAVRSDGALLLSAERLEGPTQVGLAVPGRDGEYRWQGGELQLAAAYRTYAGHFDADGGLWVGSEAGLFRLAPGSQRVAAPYRALLRSVGRLDADALFAGATDASTPQAITLPFTDRALRFEYAAPWFEHPNATEYQVRLDGLMDDWSSWSRETYRDFTSLREGDYRFEVRARNVFGELSETASWSFSVDPPWYRTPWAWASWAAAALLLLWLLLHWRTRALEADKLRLEQQVRARTEDLREARDRAEDAAAAKAGFLATISHEIRTPMNAILGFARLGRQEPDAGRAAVYLSRIESAGSTLLALVNDVLDLSRIEAGKMTLNVGEFDLHQLLAEIEELFELQARDQDLQLAFDIAADVPRHVEGDALRLRQVLINLIGNALKFTLHGQVRVEVRRTDEGTRPPATGQPVALKFSVHDTGIGIEPAQLDGLFEPFTQADASSTRRRGGAGLGLSIVRHLVDLMGGRVEATSTPSHGSCFAFELALKVRDGASLLRTPRADASIRLDGVDLLLVEDNPINQEIASRMLEGRGARVTVAGDGQAALDALETAPYDLVLMDLHMAGMDGREATARIRRMAGRERTPIIAMTAHAIAGIRDQCLADGMDDYIAKPFDPDQLFEMIRRWLDRETATAACESGDALAPHDPSDTALDSERALHRISGDQALYRRLLEDFLQRYAGLGERIHEHLDQDQRVEAGALLHSLSGVTANLGAEPLAAASRRLEFAVRGDVDADRQLQTLQAFDQALERARGAMHAYLEATVPEHTAQSPIEPQQARALLDALLRCLNEADPIAETLWQQLRGTRTIGTERALDEATRTRIDAAIDAFDYRQALALLEELIDDERT